MWRLLRTRGRSVQVVGIRTKRPSDFHRKTNRRVARNPAGAANEGALFTVGDPREVD